jgi:hypothetical protein
VTEAAVRQLAKLKGLKELSLDKYKVTDAGVKELAKALPACRIYH